MFWAAKMMKFQNNGVWERWVWIMVCYNIYVVLLSMKRDFVREIGKCENVYFVAK